MRPPVQTTHSRTRARKLFGHLWHTAQSERTVQRLLKKCFKIRCYFRTNALMRCILLRSFKAKVVKCFVLGILFNGDGHLLAYNTVCFYCIAVARRLGSR